MNELTELRNYVMMFKDGSTVWIKDEQYVELAFGQPPTKFTVDKNLYDFAMVSKILSREEYEREYPDNAVPVREYLNPEPIKDKFGSKRAIRGILKGLREYVASKEYRGTTAPFELIKHWEKRYAELEHKNS